MGEELDRQQGRLERRIHAAVPIRFTYWDRDKRPRRAMGCTYDISIHGARMTVVSAMTAVGEILAIEQGTSEIWCRVVWIGESGTKRHGQMGIQCVDPKVRLWEAQIEHMQEQYDPVKDSCWRASGTLSGGERRKNKRFAVEGTAELLRHGTDAGAIEAELKDLSSFGCRVTTKGPIVPGTNVKLQLKVGSYELKFRGQVTHSRDNLVLGIAFREVRKGDRQLLEHLLCKLDGDVIVRAKSVGA